MHKKRLLRRKKKSQFLAANRPEKGKREKNTGMKEIPKKSTTRRTEKKSDAEGLPVEDDASAHERS